MANGRDETTDEDMTICSQCCAEIPVDEAQLCGRCEMDGLGNCCIGDLDHACAEWTEDTPEEPET